MKKIIDGKRYDTTTAEKIAKWSNNYYPNDFNYMEETLYRTPKGAWFLHGEGGGLSRYAQSYGNSSGWGSDLRVLTPAEARAWLERRDCPDELEEYFGGEIVDA